MPELAEVEFMSRRLREWLEDAELTLELLDPKLDPHGQLRALRPFRVEEVFRRGKYSVLKGAQDTLLVHYRMTGKVLRGDTLPKYARATFVGERARVHFIDMRRFGTLERVPTETLESFFEGKKLGQEVWPMLRDGAWWKAQMSGLKIPIKAALLRQDRVVGLGNILASEVLFHARVAPDRPTHQVKESEWEAIAHALHQTVENILATETGDEIAYVNEGASAEDAGFFVYQRAGDAAACCGEPIERRVDAGRSTFWCPRCQR